MYKNNKMQCLMCNGEYATGIKRYKITTAMVKLLHADYKNENDNRIIVNKNIKQTNTEYILLSRNIRDHF